MVSAAHVKKEQQLMTYVFWHSPAWWKAHFIHRKSFDRIAHNLLCVFKMRRKQDESKCIYRDQEKVFSNQGKNRSYSHRYHEHQMHLVPRHLHHKSFPTAVWREHGRSLSDIIERGGIGQWN
jgi:hypothetical protein